MYLSIRQCDTFQDRPPHPTATRRQPTRGQCHQSGSETGHASEGLQTAFKTARSASGRRDGRHARWRGSVRAHGHPPDDARRGGSERQNNIRCRRTCAVWRVDPTPGRHGVCWCWVDADHHEQCRGCVWQRVVNTCNCPSACILLERRLYVLFIDDSALMWNRCIRATLLWQQNTNVRHKNTNCKYIFNKKNMTTVVLTILHIICLNKCVICSITQSINKSIVDIFYCLTKPSSSWYC